MNKLWNGTKRLMLGKRKNDDNSRNINSVTELIRSCLRSKSFDSLLVLMIGFVWCGAIMVRRAVYGGDSTGALLAIYVYPILVAIFCVALFIDMISITRGIEKGNFAMVLFIFILIFISTFVFLCFPLDI